MSFYLILTFLTFASRISCYYPQAPTGPQIQLQVFLTDGTSAYVKIDYPILTYTLNVAEAAIFTLDTQTSWLHYPDPDHPVYAPEGWNVVVTQPMYASQTFLLNDGYDYVSGGNPITCTGAVPDVVCLPVVSDREESFGVSPDSWTFCPILYAYDPKDSGSCGSSVSRWEAVVYESETIAFSVQSNATSSAPSAIRGISSSPSVSSSSPRSIAVSGSPSEPASSSKSSTRSVAASSKTVSSSVPIMASPSSLKTAVPTTVITNTTKKSTIAISTRSTVALSSAVTESVTQQIKDLQSQIAALLKILAQKPTAAVASKIIDLETKLAKLKAQQWL